MGNFEKVGCGDMIILAGLATEVSGQTDTTTNESVPADTVEVVDQSDVAQATKQVAASINIYCSGSQKRGKRR